MLIVQISDLHFYNVAKSPSEESCIKAIDGWVRTRRKRKESVVIAVCGDLTTEGEIDPYPTVKQFLHRLRNTIPGDVPTVVCPGNHDCVSSLDSGREFEHFNSVARSFGQITPFGPAVTIYTMPIDDTDFLVMNSAHHCDYKFGASTYETLGDQLDESTSRHRIIIIHHHFIPSDGDKQSAIRESHNTLQTAVTRNVRLILHGHLHRSRIVRLGEPSCAVIGVGSLQAQASPRTHNTTKLATMQFNIVRWRRGKVSLAKQYRYLGRADGTHTISGFEESDLLPFEECDIIQED